MTESKDLSAPVTKADLLDLRQAIDAKFVEQLEKVEKLFAEIGEQFKIVNNQFMVVFKHIEMVIADVNEHTDDVIAEVRSDFQQRDSRQRIVARTFHQRLRQVESQLGISS